MNLKIVASIIIILAVIPLSYLLITRPSSPGEKSDIVTIKYSQMKFYDPVFVAAEKGFFQDEGIEIEWVGEMYGGPQMITAVATGSADAGTAAITALANAKANGMGVKGVADVQSSFEEAPIHIWYVLNDSNINSPQDLIGKKIGVNTLGAAFHYITLEYLKNNDIPESDVEFVTIPFPNMEQALRSNQVDVAGMPDPFNTRVESNGGVRRLFTTIDAAGELQVVLTFFSDAFINEHPEAVRRFIRAYDKAIDFIYSNPVESKEIFSKYIGVEPEYIVHHKFQPHAKVDLNSVQKWIDILVESGQLEEDQIQPEDIATNEYNSL
jgi:ABC-type nitrate/sulfonate/bicarbonate transport system substrate-binding protein